MPLLSELDQGLRPETRARLALAVLVAAWLFGGATRFDVLAPSVPLLVGLGVIAICAAARGAPPLTLLEKLCWGGLFAVPLVQLVPLPPSLWSGLPTHGYPRDLMAALGLEAWLPLSLTPSRTLSSGLAFVPAFAVYLCARWLPAREATRLLTWLGGFAVVSALLGLLQVSAGSGSRLRFYAITNSDAAVGLFSNANHFGTFIALCIPVVIYLGLRQAALRDPRQERAVLAFAVGIAVVLAIGALASFSRAAYGATALGLILSTVLVLLHLPLRSKVRLAWGAAVGAGITVAAAVLVLSGRFAALAELDRVGTDGRLALVPTFARMALDALPFGTGLGSFDPVYRAHEDYLRLSSRYLNNAHNDLAQVLIETGLLGAALLLAWAALLATIFRTALREPERLERDPLFARSKVAVLAFGIIVLLAHSLVDYPLRGASVSATFALLLAQALGAGSLLPRSVRNRHQGDRD